MQYKYHYVLTNGSLTILIDGIPHSITQDHPNYENVKSIVVDLSGPSVDQNALLDMIKPIERLKRIVTESGTFEVDNYGSISIQIKGHMIKMPTTVATYAMQLHDENGDLNPLYNFCVKLADHPDSSVFEELFGFMVANGFVLNAVGNIVAYKNVTADFKDIYTKTIDNSPGSVVTMPRQAVERNSDKTCSSGLHFAAYSYLQHYAFNSGTRCVLVEVDPRNVVSVPTDYNSAKVRCCEYKVLREVEKPQELADAILFREKMEEEEYLEEMGYQYEDINDYGDDDDDYGDRSHGK